MANTSAETCMIAPMFFAFAPLDKHHPRWTSLLLVFTPSPQACSRVHTWTQHGCRHINLEEIEPDRSKIDAQKLGLCFRALDSDSLQLIHGKHGKICGAVMDRPKVHPVNVIPKLIPNCW